MEFRSEEGRKEGKRDMSKNPESITDAAVLHYHYLRILGVIRTKLDGLAGDGRTIFHSL